MSLHRPLAGALLVGYAAAVAFIVFWPSGDIASDSVEGIWELLGAPEWLPSSTVEVLTNVLLFVPLSLLGSAFRPRWGWLHWLGAGLAATLAIETVQAALLPGRSWELVDLAANSLGALVGYWLVLLGRRTVAARSRADRGADRGLERRGDRGGLD